MRRLPLFLALSVLLLSCSGRPGSVPQGQNVGNSGDFIQGLFEQGRLHALRVLDRVTPSYLPRYLKDRMSPDEITWFFGKKGEIQSDLAGASHHWVAQLPHSECPHHPELSCACRPPGEGSPVLLSYASCDPKSTVAEVGQLLLHESLHRFLGGDEKKVYRIAGVIYGAFLASKFNQFPHLLIDPSIGLGISDGAPDALVAWTGKALLRWPRFWEPLALFDPGTNRWRWQRLEPRPFEGCDFLSSTGNRAELTVTATRVDNLLVVLPRARLQGRCDEKHGRFGIVLNLNDFTWRPVSGFEGLGELFDDGYYHAVAGGNRLFLSWVPKHPSRKRIGAIYDPANDRWQPMASYDSEHDTEQYTFMVWAGNRLVLWQRRYYEEIPDDSSNVRDIRDNAGLVYDPAANRWSRMRTEGAPRNLYVSPVAVSIGDKMLVYGGVGHDYVRLYYSAVYDFSAIRSFEPLGAVFAPATNTWEPIRTDGAPSAVRGADPVNPSDFSPLLGAFDGTRVLIYGRDLRFYHPERNEWTVSDQTLDDLPFQATRLIFTGLESFLLDARGLRSAVFIP